MNLAVRYCSTPADRVAYTVTGSGPPLLCETGRVSHLRSQLEVAGLVAEGLTNHSIGPRLSIAPRTAEAHVENIRRKLQVHSRAQIARWVTEHRMRTQAPR